MGAEVFLGSQRLGVTPLLNHPLPEGTHQLRMVLDNTSSDREIRVEQRGANRYIWTGGDEWQVHF